MFFSPNLGGRNAKNPFGPFKVPQCKQKGATLKKINVIYMAPADLKGRSGKMLTSAKNNINILTSYKHRHPILKSLFLLQITYLHESLEGLNSSLAQSDGELLPGEKCLSEWLLREQNFGQFLIYEPYFSFPIC